MKVVLFCGGFGTRMQEYSETIPKPLVTIGYRPILWHLMKYYSHFGHNEFILCLGYRGDLIKNYFLNYDECLSNDFVLEEGGRSVSLFDSDIEDWKITFCDTGLQSNIGQRLLRIRHLLDEDEMFLANYSDGLSDIDLALQLENFNRGDAVACFGCVRPSYSLSAVKLAENGNVEAIEYINRSDIWINGGFMMLRKEIFNYINEGEELVEEPFQRLISEQKLLAHKHEGFWMAMDTFKDKKGFDEMYRSGETPWQLW